MHINKYRAFAFLIGILFFAASGNTLFAKTIYVSSSGSDTNNGESISTPVKTLDKAYSLISTNSNDEILLKRGDSWDQGFSGFFEKSGKSGTARIVIGAYGTGSRPIVNVKDGLSSFLSLRPANVSKQPTNIIKNIEVRDIYARGYFNTAQGKNAPVGFRVAEGFENIYLKNMRIEGFRYNIETASCYYNKNCSRTTFSITDSLLANAYPGGAGHSQCLYIDKTQGIEVRANTFFRCGYMPDKNTLTYDPNVPVRNATQFNHAVYLQSDNGGNTTVKDNLFVQSSSFGVQVRSGGVVENNVFDRVSYGLVVAQNKSTVKNNVMLHLEEHHGTPPSGIIIMPLLGQTVVEGNIIANSTNGTGNAFDIKEVYTFGEGHNPSLPANYSFSLRDNVTYNAGRPLNVTGAPSVDDGNIYNNKFTNTASTGSYRGCFSSYHGTRGGIKYDNNIFDCSEAGTGKYKAANIELPTSVFKTFLGVPSVNESNITYNNPTRSLESYVATVGYANSFSGLSQAILKEDTNLSAAKILPYIRGGFSATIASPSPSQSPAPKGTVLIKRVIGPSNDIFATPTTVTLGTTTTSTNFVTISNVAAGSSTVKVTIPTGYTAKTASCQYTGATECTIASSAYVPASCTNGNCSVAVPVAAQKTTKLLVQYTSNASATLDTASLTATSSMPTITGTATNVAQPFGVSIAGASGDKIWGSGTITVTNNKWSTKLTQALPSGTYKVNVYSNNVLLTSGTLSIRLPSPSPTPTKTPTPSPTITRSPSPSVTPKPTIPIPTLSCTVLTKELKRNDTDSTTSGEVTKLQKFLYNKGFLNINQTVEGYGTIGGYTEDAIKAFQKANGLDSSTGRVGPNTRTKIKDISCGTLTLNKDIGGQKFNLGAAIPLSLKLANTISPQVTVTLYQQTSTGDKAVYSLTYNTALKNGDNEIEYSPGKGSDFITPNVTTKYKIKIDLGKEVVSSVSTGYFDIVVPVGTLSVKRVINPSNELFTSTTTVTVGSTNTTSNVATLRNLKPGQTTVNVTVPTGFTAKLASCDYNGATECMPSASSYVTTDCSTTNCSTAIAIKDNVTSKLVVAYSPVCNALDTKNLSIVSSSATTASVKNNSPYCSYQVGLAAYREQDSSIVNQVLSSNDVKTIAPGQTANFTITPPTNSCKYHLDLFVGPLVTKFNSGNDWYNDRILKSGHWGGNYCPNPTPTPTPTPIPLACTTLTKLLYQSNTDANTGGEVTQLQKFLIATKYLTLSSNTEKMGTFGTTTNNAVKAFQRANNLDASTGNVGPNSRDKIKAISCKTSAAVEPAVTPSATCPTPSSTRLGAVGKALRGIQNFFSSFFGSQQAQLQPDC